MSAVALSLLLLLSAGTGEQAFWEVRIELADVLYTSVQSQEEIDKAWEKEIERRVDDYEAGRTQVLTAEEVHARVEKAILEARRARSGRID